MVSRPVQFCIIALLSLSRLSQADEQLSLASLSTSAGGYSSTHNYCISDQNCLNGGVCRVSDADSSVKHCHCPEGVSGHRCEEYCPLTCHNQGHCYAVVEKTSTTSIPKDIATFRDEYGNKAPDYACKCLGHFQGPLCEVPYENCADGRQCLNGGSCQQVDNSSSASTCKCTSGFDGDTCENKVTVQADSTSESDTYAYLNLLMAHKKLVVTILLASITFLASIMVYLLIQRYQRTVYKSVAAREESSTSNSWRNVV